MKELQNEVEQLRSKIAELENELVAQTLENKVLLKSKKLLEGKFATVVQDVTQRKKGELELTKLTAAVEQSANTIVITDINGNIEYVNPKFTELTGYTAEEAIGENPRILNAGTQAKEYYCELWRTISAGKTWEGEFHNKTKTGEFFWEHVIISPIKNDAGEISNYLGIKENITAQKKAEEKQKTMISNISDVIAILDKKSIITYQSPNIKELFGWTPEELNGKSGFVNIHNDDKKRIQQEFKNLLGGENKKLQVEYKYRCRNGKYKTVHCTANNLIANKHINGVLLNYHDISRQKDSEQLLRDSEIRFKALHNASFGGIAIHDFGIILECNNGLAEISGYAIEELIGMDGFLLIAEKWRDIIKKNVASGMEKPYEAMGLRKNGEEYPLRLEARNIPYKGKMVRTVEFRDISDQKGYEKELIANETRLDTLLQISQMTNPSLNEVYTITLEKALELTHSKIGIIGFVNDKNTKLSIHDWPEVVTKECKNKELSHEFEVANSKIWSEVIRTGQPIMINDYSAPNPLKKGLPEGHIKIENYLIVPIYSNKKIVATISVSNKETNYNNSDIKQLTLLLNGMWKSKLQINAQNDLKEALKNATESERLKTAFLANMSHEIRTPMNGILGFSELLKDPEISPEEALKYHSIIEKSGERLMNTINDLVDISLIDSDQVSLYYSDIEIEDLVDRVVDVNTLLAKDKNLSLSVLHAPSLKGKTIRSDEKTMLSILNNLVTNAIKYTKSGSIVVGYKQVKNSVVFEIKDTGIGIAQERLDTIFERFIQEDMTNTRGYEGMGLGLSICQAYTEKLNGKIWVESEKGKGSTFYLSLPIKN